MRSLRGATGPGLEVGFPSRLPPTALRTPNSSRIALCTRYPKGISQPPAVLTVFSAQIGLQGCNAVLAGDGDPIAAHGTCQIPLSEVVPELLD